MRKFEVWEKGDGLVSVFYTKKEARIERKRLQSNGRTKIYISLIKGYRRISDFHQGWF